MVEQLYLNRPQLLLERREAQSQDYLENALPKVKMFAEKLLEKDDPTSRRLLRELVASQVKVTELLLKQRDVLPYRTQDITRPNT